MASQNPSSVPLVLPNALPPLNNAINNSTPQWLPYNGGAGVGVSQIVAGSGIAVSPTNGVGNVTVSTVASSPFAQGMVMLWDKVVSIPTGWALCNGATVNGYVTPSIQDVFVVGTGTTYPTCGLGGGAASVALTLNMIPDHTHGGVGLSTVSSPVDTGGYSYASNSSSTTGISNAGYTPGTAVPTLPPYYSMTYICYVGVAP
jgi:hypothetical protein